LRDIRFLANIQSEFFRQFNGVARTRKEVRIRGCNAGTGVESTSEHERRQRRVKGSIEKRNHG
jgi:hypothetical protein